MHGKRIVSSLYLSAARHFHAQMQAHDAVSALVAIVAERRRKASVVTDSFGVVG